MARRPRWTRVLTLLAAVALVAGIAAYAWGVRTATFGWFAYAPLSTDAVVDHVAASVARQRAGEALIAAGLLMGGVMIGASIERRRALRGAPGSQVRRRRPRH